MRCKVSGEENGAIVDDPGNSCIRRLTEAQRRAVLADDLRFV